MASCPARHEADGFYTPAERTPLLSGTVCQLEWVTPADVAQAWQVFAAHQDKGWSFTDCVSRVVIERLGVATVFAFGVHFRQFGTLTVVP